MFRLIALFLAVGASVALALWLASTSGYIELRVGDYEIRRSFAWFVLILALGLLAWGVVFHSVMRTMAIPAAIARAGRDNRAKKGHKALSDGLVAVASGDPDEARRQARIAARYLENPAASLLLTAQSAQLNGQMDAAERYFEAMLDEPATRFLGLRGLIVKALKSGDSDRALGLLLEAKSIKPKAPWVLDLEYQLRLDRGELKDAEAVAQKLRRLTAADPDDSGMKVAVSLLAQAVDDQQNDDLSQALDKAVKATRAAPNFFAAHAMVARTALAQGKKRRAIEALQAAWAIHPSGDVANRMLTAKSVKPGDFDGKLAVAKLLANHNPNHWASLAVTVDAMIDVGAREQAKALLEQWDNIDLEPELVALKDRMKRGEGYDPHEDADRAQRFALSEGFFACTACGTHQDFWHSHCAECGSTSSIRYQSRVAAQPEHDLAIAPVPLIDM